MITFCLIAIILHYLIIYLAYLPVSRKDVSQGKMHITSLKVAGLSFLTGFIAGFVDIPSSVGVPITALIIYHMGRSQLLQSRKQAWASTGIYIGLSIPHHDSANNGIRGQLPLSMHVKIPAAN